MVCLFVCDSVVAVVKVTKLIAETRFFMISFKKDNVYMLRTNHLGVTECSKIALLV